MSEQKTYEDYVETINILNAGVGNGGSKVWRIREETTLPVEELRDRIQNSTIRAKILSCGSGRDASQDTPSFPLLTQVEFEYLMGYSDTKPEEV